jgi:hypothetical protein
MISLLKYKFFLNKHKITVTGETSEMLQKLLNISKPLQADLFDNHACRLKAVETCARIDGIGLYSHRNELNTDTKNST